MDKQPKTNAKQYFAFISYSSQDEKIVRWLHHSLENYRLPTSIASDGKSEQPKYLRPIFWYKQDLSGTVLSESLRANLSDSRYLIVICSPAAARSQWVNDEITTFIAQGKGDKIIPVIASGKPNAEPLENECFPKALRNLGRERELRGIDLRDQGRKHALVDIIATMLGVKFDTLWQRHKRRERRTRALRGLVIFLCAVLSLGVWDYNRELTRYYLDYADVYGIPQGIDRISKKEVADAGYAYRFTYSRTPIGQTGALSWRLDKIEYVNSAGTIYWDIPDNHALFYPVQEFRYQEGKLAEITNKDFYGRTRLRYSVKDDLDGNAASIYDITGSEVEQSAGYLTASTAPSDQAYDPNKKDVWSKIKRLHLVRNETGYVESIHYHSNNDDDLNKSLTADNNGFYGQKFTLDPSGRILTMTFLGRDGNPTEDFRGVATTAFSYGEPRTIEYRNASGEPAYGKLRVSKIEIHTNGKGRAESVRYYNHQGLPILSEEYAHRVNYKYDKSGFVTEISAFDIEGQPAILQNGCHKILIENDRRGRQIRQSYFDRNEAPTLNSNIYFSTELEYHPNGMTKCIRYFNTLGEAAYNPNEGDYGQRYSYDANGYRTQTELLGPDGKAAISPETSYAVITFEYDKYHRCTKMLYLDTEGKPTRCMNHHAGVLRKYDSRGNEIELIYIGPDGKATTPSGGAAIVRRRYDARGNVTEVRYYNAEGRAAYPAGRHGEQAAYSPDGQQTMKKYIDSEGHPMRGKDWWAYRIRQYNERGQLVEESYLDPDSLPTIERERLIAKIVYTDDQVNHQANVSYFGTDNTPINSKEGYHIVRSKYDKRHKILSRRYYAADGRKASYNGQYHMDSMSYDERGNTLMIAIYDTEGNPLETKERIHRREWDYDVRGLAKAERRYDRDGKLHKPITKEDYSVMIREFNDRGQIINSRYYDHNMKPYGRMTNDRCAYREESLYELSAKPTRINYYSHNDTVNPNYSVFIKYNAYGEVIELSYLDADGKPIDIGTGSRVLTGYDSHNRPISLKEYSSAGKLIAYQKLEYDSLGRIEAKHMLGKDSCLTIGQTRGMTERYATMRTKYDSEGNVTEYAYYDTSGALMDAGNNYAIIRYDYDNLNRRKTTRVYDKSGNPCKIGTKGWHIESNKYDDRNLLVMIDYFGTDGRPVNMPTGTGLQSRIKFNYDEYGHRTDIEALEWNGKEYVKPEPFAKAASKESGATQILGLVETPGSFRDSGIEGAFYILIFDSWDIHQSLDRFAEVLGSTGNRPRRIVYVPLQTKNNQIFPGKPVDRVFPAGPLGVRLMDTNYEDVSDFLESAYNNLNKK